MEELLKQTRRTILIHLKLFKYVIELSGSERKVQSQQASLNGAMRITIILRNKKQVNNIKIMFMKNRTWT